MQEVDGRLQHLFALADVRAKSQIDLFHWNLEQRGLVAGSQPAVDFEVVEGAVGGHAAARRAMEEAELNEIARDCFDANIVLPRLLEIACS